MKTHVVKPSEIVREWLLIDATNVPLGRLASKVAVLLRGKHKPLYSPSIDCGDNVVIINAKKVLLTGRKPNTKYYHHYSGYVGGLKSVLFSKMIEKKPEYPIYIAVKRMMPRNRLLKKIMKKLYIFEGDHNLKNVNLKKIEII